MRIRTIKPEFFTHDRLFEAESASKLPLRIAFAGLWCAADREGRFKWEPRRLGVQILPYDGIDFSRVLDALVTRGFLVKYASGTAEFGWIPGFPKHQVINNKERASELPEPILVADSNACPTRASRDSHACRKEGKGMEGNMEQGMEGNEGVPHLSLSPDPPKKSKSKPMNLDEVFEYADKQGIKHGEAEDFWDSMEAGGWKRGQQKIADWQAHMRTYHRRGWLKDKLQPSQQSKSYNQQDREAKETARHGPVTITPRLIEIPE